MRKEPEAGGALRGSDLFPFKRMKNSDVWLVGTDRRAGRLDVGWRRQHPRTTTAWRPYIYRFFPVRVKNDIIPMGFMILTMVGRDRWARRVGFGGPSGPALPPIAEL